MYNYLDPLHYTSDVGHLILSRVYHDGTAEPPADFGVLVTPANVDQHIASLDDARMRWRESAEYAHMQAVLEAP